jgi:hypothetical protein
MNEQNLSEVKGKSSLAPGLDYSGLRRMTADLKVTRSLSARNMGRIAGAMLFLLGMVSVSSLVYSLVYKIHFWWNSIPVVYQPEHNDCNSSKNDPTLFSISIRLLTPIKKRGKTPI